jgi:predicted short-subunit dehydrogenase-like oxidoreductase (DUF2520 family)
MRVAIVGRGRLGRTLAQLLPAAGHPVTATGRGEAPAPADVVLVCVPDGAVAEVARGLALPEETVVLHCAGALDTDVLAPHRRRGSLHPLMTFPGPEVAVPDLRGTPAAVAGTDDAVAVATTLARDLGLAPFAVPGDRRLYHAAAVLAGNLALVLVDEAARVLVAAGVDPAYAATTLIPLAAKSVDNARYGLGALTGPIARGDDATLRAHLDALGEHGLSGTRDLYEHLVKHALARLRHRNPPDRAGG